MRSYSSREVIQALKADGWYVVNIVLAATTSLSTRQSLGVSQ